MTINRELLDAVYWTDFGAFTYEAFKAARRAQRRDRLPDLGCFWDDLLDCPTAQA